MDIRVKIFKNSKNPVGGKLMAVDKKNLSFEEFLNKCSVKLGIKAVYAYDSKGCQIEEVETLREDDDVFISQGEPFFPHESNVSFASQNLSGFDNKPSFYQNTNFNSAHSLQGISSGHLDSKQTVIKPSSLIQQQKKNLFRVALIGEGGVGKSAITFRYVYKKFLEQYANTIEDFYTRRAYIDNELAEIDILDTAGLEEFKVVRDASIKEREGFIVVYDVTNPETFSALNRLYDLLKTFHPTKRVPTVIVGNKIDLPNKAVDSTFGQKMANKFQGTFLECSALTGDNVEEAFAELVRDIRRSRESRDNGKSKEKVSFFKKYCAIL